MKSKEYKIPFTSKYFQFLIKDIPRQANQPKKNSGRKKMPFRKIVITVLLVLMALIIFIYFLSFTQINILKNNVEKYNEIGDAMGGMSSPLIGLISALLVYLSFQEQIKANLLVTGIRKEDTLAQNLKDYLERIEGKLEKIINTTGGQVKFNQMFLMVLVHFKLSLLTKLNGLTILIKIFQMPTKQYMNSKDYLEI